MLCTSLGEGAGCSTSNPPAVTPPRCRAPAATPPLPHPRCHTQVQLDEKELAREHRAEAAKHHHGEHAVKDEAELRKAQEEEQRRVQAGNYQEEAVRTDEQHRKG